jgi:hypothetical protein
MSGGAVNDFDGQHNFFSRHCEPRSWFLPFAARRRSGEAISNLIMRLLRRTEVLLAMTYNDV